MNITTDQKKKIEQVINVFETGSREGDYANVTIYADGRGGTRQITYGRSQTTEQGNLRELLELFCQRFPQSAELSGYEGFCRVIKDRLPKVGKTPLTGDQEFITALKKCGKINLMHDCQDEFFDRRYWMPALNWAKGNGFEKALSMLVIYDSFIHSGGILDFLRNRFAAVPPARGGKEEDWVKQYVDTRKSWLLGKGGLLAKTIYRMETMQDALKKGNWDLSQPLRANGVVI